MPLEQSARLTSVEIRIAASVGANWILALVNKVPELTSTNVN